MPIDIEGIVAEIAPLSLKAALALLCKKGIKDFTGKGYEKIKQILHSKSDKQPYAFVPNKREAEALRELSKDPNYQTVKSLIPKYRYIDVIRTGLLLKSYIEKDDARTRLIKSEIASRPNGKKMMTIVHLVTTPHFSTVIFYLARLKSNQGYSENQLLGKFEEIVDDWDGSYCAVRSQDTVVKIKKLCTSKMKEGRRNIFLLGMKGATKKIELVVKQLKDDGLFEEYGYEVITVKSESGVEPRIEVTFRYRSEMDKFIESD